MKTQGGAVPRQVRLLPCLPPRTTFPSHRCTFWLLYRPSPRRAAHSSFLRGESGTLTRTINHPREVPFSSPISYLLALERRHGRESSLVTVDVANVIQHSKQRGCCACERARARVCFFFFSFLFFFWWGVEETEEEVGERGDMKRVCLCLLRDPLSVTDHRLSFTCTNDLAIATEILLTRFPWRSSLSFYP